LVAHFRSVTFTAGTLVAAAQGPWGDVTVVVNVAVAVSGSPTPVPGLCRISCEATPLPGLAVASNLLFGGTRTGFVLASPTTHSAVGCVDAVVANVLGKTFKFVNSCST
jgi:hypothetical protein